MTYVARLVAYKRERLYARHSYIYGTIGDSRRAGRREEGGKRVVSMYERAYHPIRTLALGLLYAPISVHLPCTLGNIVYLSIHLLSGGASEDRRGRRRWMLIVGEGRW